MGWITLIKTKTKTPLNPAWGHMSDAHRQVEVDIPCSLWWVFSAGWTGWRLPSEDRGKWRWQQCWACEDSPYTPFSKAALMLYGTAFLIQEPHYLRFKWHHCISWPGLVDSKVCNTGFSLNICWCGFLNGCLPAMISPTEAIYMHDGKCGNQHSCNCSINFNIFYF